MREKGRNIEIGVKKSERNSGKKRREKDRVNKNRRRDMEIITIGRKEKNRWEYRENWNRHFMDLLKSSLKRVIMKERNDDRHEEETTKKEWKEEEISREEFEAIKSIGKRKSMGQNGIENEVWRLMPKEIGEVFYEMCD